MPTRGLPGPNPRVLKGETDHEHKTGERQQPGYWSGADLSSRRRQPARWWSSRSHLGHLLGCWQQRGRKVGNFVAGD